LIVWVLACDGPCFYSVFQIKSRTDGADDAVVAAQSKLRAQAIDAFDAGAMRAENLCGLIFLQFPRGPIDLFVFRVVEMKATNRAADRSGPDRFACKLKRIDQTGMAAAGKEHQPARSIEDERLIIGYVVLNPLVTYFDFNAARIIFLGICARHRTREPNARHNLLRLVDHDEFSAGAFELFL